MGTQLSLKQSASKREDLKGREDAAGHNSQSDGNGEAMEPLNKPFARSKL